MKKVLYNKRLFARAPKLIGLDIGCGLFKQEPLYGMPFLGMDMVKHPCVDIVHNLQKFPWPVPAHSIQVVKASHVWEHIEPKYRFQFMDECWRICRPGGQLWLSSPYATSPLAFGHPAHYMCPNEMTFQFFDPDCRLWHACSYKKPLPWKIVRCDANHSGCIELVMDVRKTDKGRPILPKKPAVKDEVKLKRKET